MTQDARALFDIVEQHAAPETVTDIRARLTAAVAAREIAEPVTVAALVWAIRNVGKAPGHEVAVGQPTEPLRGGYPEGR